MASNLPKTLGTTADKLYELAESIKILKKRHDDEMKKLRGRQRVLEAHATALLAKERTDTASGKVGIIERQTVVKPIVNDWGRLYRYIEEQSTFDMLQKRLNEAAIKERWADGIVVPGVERAMIFRLSVRKVPAICR